MGKYRVALIGSGRMASSIDDEIRDQETWPSLKCQLPYSHAPTYLAFADEVEIVAVCDLEESRAKAFCRRWGVERYYIDYQEMLTRERPDIVSITTPATSHAELAIFACNHGVRGIYCEKPMCCSLLEVDALVEAVHRNGVRFMLGAQRRHHPHFRKTHELVQSGALGELVSATSWMGSSLLHSISHSVDGMLYMANDVPAVSVYGLLGAVTGIDETENRRVVPLEEYDPQAQRWNGDPGCNVYIARLVNGVLINHLPAVTDLRFEMVCTDGYIRILNNNDSLEIYKRRGLTYSFDPLPIPAISPASAHKCLVRDLLDSLRTGRKPLANELVARNGMEILMGAAQSHATGGATVQLPLADRRMYIPAH